ncbi:MAG: hypothetical protein R3A45_13210 [Bdellovibrionota bacterium]
MKQPANADAFYQKAIDMNKRIGSSDTANHYASKAEMALLEKTFKQYMRIQLTMPQSALERNIKKKYDLLKILKKEYVRIVKMNDPEVGINALFKLGLCYQDFSQALFTAPLPDNLSPEEIQLYQVELQNQALPIEEQAIESFESALKKSQQLNVYTQTAKDAYTQLSQYKPQDYPPVPVPTY